MSLRTLMPMLIVLTSGASAQETIGLTPGMVISHSSKIVPSERLTVSSDRSTVALKVTGNDITIDFTDAFVRGTKDPYHDRENFEGTGLLIDGCKNVTIKGGHFQGFRWNIRIVNSENVRIENSDVSLSRAIRMMKDGSPVDTFLNLRDSNAWRGYGAGIWIEASTGCTLEKCYGTGALIGAALVDTSHSTVHNCDFSFNGGWGIALSRSSDNVVSWNQLDFVNRTWGGGWGGDSAALAVADNCDRNYFVGNSMTHGGDGFFLSNRNDIGPRNPQSGVYEPQGGSDGNIVAYNDGSWSPNNAFEGTFSDGNVYFGNVANWSGYGYWLGFSTNTLLLKNVITDIRTEGIAIEQGRGSRIEENRFERIRGTAIHLWGSGDPARKPFPSTGIDIQNNTIRDSGTAIDVDGSTDVAIKGNTIVRARDASVSSSQRNPASAVTAFQATASWSRLQQVLASRPADFQMYAARHCPKGVDWLQPAEYGPKDFRDELAAKRQVDPGVIELYLMESGVKVTAPDWANFEDTPDDPYIVRITAKPTEGDAGEDRPITILLQSKDGQRKQTTTGILRTAYWTLKWYSWRGITYDDVASWNRLWASNPIKTETTRNLGGDWTGKSPSDGVPNHHFALAATTVIKMPPGRYILHSVSDDGIRVFLDGRLMIDRWNHHGPTADNVPIDMDAGPHNIRVEYCQEDGAAVLRLDWSKQ